MRLPFLVDLAEVKKVFGQRMAYAVMGVIKKDNGFKTVPKGFLNRSERV